MNDLNDPLNNTVTSNSSKPFPTISSAILSTIKLLEFDSEGLFRQEVFKVQQLVEYLNSYSAKDPSSTGLYKDNLKKLSNSIKYLVGSKNEMFEFYCRVHHIFRSFIFDAVNLLIICTHKSYKNFFNDSVELFMDLLDFVEDTDKLSNDLFCYNENVLPICDDDQKEPFKFLQFYYNNLLGHFEDYLKVKFDLKDSLKIEDFYESDGSDSATSESTASFSDLSSKSSNKDSDRLTLFQIMKLNEIAQSKDHSLRFINKIFKFIYYSYGCLTFNINKEFLRISIEIIISYAHMNRIATLNMIHLFICRNKNTIVNNLDNYRITLNRAPFSLITRYVFKCYFKFANDDYYEEFKINTLDMAFKTFMNLRLKCIRIIGDYIKDIDQDIIKLNMIGGQAFSTILSSFEKILFDMLFKVFEKNLIALGKNRFDEVLDHLSIEQSTDQNCIKADLIKLTAECLSAMRPFFDENSKYEESFYLLMELMITLLSHMQMLNKENDRGFQSLKKHVYSSICQLIHNKIIKVNFFIYKHWPKLKKLWLNDLYSEFSTINGSLMIVETMCKNYRSEDLDHLIELSKHFCKFLTSIATNDQQKISKDIFSSETVNAICHILKSYGMLVEFNTWYQEDNSLKSTLSAGLVTFRKEVHDLLNSLVNLLVKLKPDHYFKATLNFYSKILSFEKPDEFFLRTERSIWQPHIDLMMLKIRQTNQIFNRKFVFILADFFKDKFVEVFSLISGINWFCTNEYLVNYKYDMLYFLEQVKYEREYQNELIHNYIKLYKLL